MAEYHRRRSRVLTRLAKLHPDEYRDLLALERVNDGLAPEQGNQRIARCGTRSGAQAHYRKDEGLCEPCRRAEREYDQERREKAGNEEVIPSATPEATN